jgi:putative ABC transport system ATP-binding protein
MNIELINVSKKFDQGKSSIQVLNELNLTIKSSEIIALLGKSGSGKTTLLSLIAGLEKTQTGLVRIDGINLADLSEDELCKFRSNKCGIIFQQFHLIPHLTALENVLLPLQINQIGNKEIAMSWLEKVGLAERAEHFPNMLSGGEQQRVAIARALAFGPELILADEPTGNLDTQTGEKIIELLFNIVREKKTTMIFVTHDEELASKADKIIHLKDGKCFG